MTPPLRQRPEDQPLPVRHDDQPAIHDLVIADVQGRRRLGIQRYGTPLQPHNGRDALRDLYEELLDAACYARQALEERRNPAFVVIERMQQRIDHCAAENRRLTDLVDELRRQVRGALRLAARHGAPIQDWHIPNDPTDPTPAGGEAAALDQIRRHVERQAEHDEPGPAAGGEA